MSEGASQLDLQILGQEIDTARLVPAEKKIPIIQRNSGRILVLLLTIGIFATLVQWISNSFQPGIYPVIVVVFLLVSVSRREAVRQIYFLSEKGLHIPYMWFFTRVIPLENVVRVVDDEIVDEESGRKYGAIRILVDTPLMLLNITGLQTSNILLSTMYYDSIDLNRFADEILRRKRESGGVPNTLAQRLTDQVDRAWSNRWLIIILKVLDGSTEALIYLFLLESFIFGFFNVSIWPRLGGILLGAYFLLILLFQMFDKPQAIIGIRPHELGPLIYDEEELITSVRFILMCHPYTVNLKNCELIYPEDVARQVGRLNQIHPQNIEPGELAYGVAQIVGNHTKAKGAVITFTYKETEETGREYQIPIEWA